jgi:hypothetical protein
VVAESCDDKLPLGCGCLNSETSVQGHDRYQSLCLRIFHVRFGNIAIIKIYHDLEEGNKKKGYVMIVKQSSCGDKTKCHKSHPQMAISNPVPKDISRMMFASRSLLITSSWKMLLLARLSFCVTSDIINTTTSTLGCVLKSGRSIRKRLSDSASNVANDTSDGVDSA